MRNKFDLKIKLNKKLIRDRWRGGLCKLTDQKTFRCISRLLASHTAQILPIIKSHQICKIICLIKTQSTDHIILTLILYTEIRQINEIKQVVITTKDNIKIKFKASNIITHEMRILIPKIMSRTTKIKIHQTL